MPFKKKEQEEKVVRQEVRIFSKEALYRRVPYKFSVPKSVATGNYVTGQDMVIWKEQINAKGEAEFINAPLSANDLIALKMGDNPYLIKPGDFYTLHNGRKFDLTYTENSDGTIVYHNPKDYAEYNFFTRLDEVALTLNEYQKGKHYFYIENKEIEAQRRVTNREKVLAASNFIASNTSIGRMRDIALLINHMIPKEGINVETLSITQLQDKIYSVCDREPDVILKLRDGDKNDINSEILFAIKAIQASEVTYRESMYYYGNNYIGNTFESVIDFLRKPENSVRVAKIGTVTKKKDMEFEQSVSIDN